MPAPFSTLAFSSISYAALGAYARGTSAVSQEAHAAQDAATELVKSVERSQVLFGTKAVAISQLRALQNECASEGWNGSDAAAVSPIAVIVAETFVRAMPDHLPMPEFSAEPDGAVSLDWIQSRNRLFTLSAGTNNRLAYAWIDGTDRGHAVARFDGDRISQRILEGIEAITGHAPAALGA